MLKFPNIERFCLENKHRQGTYFNRQCVSKHQITIQTLVHSMEAIYSNLLIIQVNGH